jgi:membrane protein YqaA with SNARE-associated domain
MGIVVFKGQIAIDWPDPHLATSANWLWATTKMKDWGDWALILFNIGPFPILPLIAFAVLSKISVLNIFLMTLFGKTAKFYELCCLVTRIPAREKST